MLRGGVSTYIAAVFILAVLLAFLISMYMVMRLWGEVTSNVISTLSARFEEVAEGLRIVNTYLTPEGLVAEVLNNGSRTAYLAAAYVRNASTSSFTYEAMDTAVPPQSIKYVLIKGAFKPGAEYVVALITRGGRVLKAVENLTTYVTFVVIVNRVAEELRNYQVEVLLNSSWVGWPYVGGGGGSIYFTDARGNPLHYWVERFNPAAREALIWVKIPKLPPSGREVIVMHYGGRNPYAPYYGGPYGTFYYFVNLSQWVVGRLAGTATYYPTLHILQLTANLRSEKGFLVLGKAPSEPVGFEANFTFRAYGGTGADAVWVGAYDTTYVGTTEDIVDGGYHFTFDEYQDRIAFTNSTVDNGPPLAYAFVTNINNGLWHEATVRFWYDPASRSATALIYYDGALVVNYTVGVAYSQINVMLGRGVFFIGGRTGALTDYHQLEGVISVRKYVEPQPAVTITELP